MALRTRKELERHTPERRLRYLLSILGLTILGSTLGYWLLDPRPDASALDALYMTFITIATVGYKEVYPLTQSGKIFTILVIAFSAVTLVYTIGTLGQFFIEGEMRRILGRRKMDKKLRKLKDHYIIAGAGRVGQIVREELEKAGVPYVVLDRNINEATDLAEGSHAYISGDATEDDILLAAGIESAKCLVCTIPSDADAVYITLSARQLNPGIFIIARADSQVARKKLERAGADRVVMPHDTGGKRMAMVSLKPNLVDSLSIESFGGELGLEIEEVEVPASCPFAGKTLRDSGLRLKYGATVVAIRKADGRKLVNPQPETLIEGGDVLVLFAEKGRLATLDLIGEQC
ncbi:MAG: potassium channel protein [bacterium]